MTAATVKNRMFSILTLENFASKLSPAFRPYRSRIVASDINLSVILFLISVIVRAISILLPV